jgi:hypothetical protein
MDFISPIGPIGAIFGENGSGDGGIGTTNGKSSDKLEDDNDVSGGVVGFNIEDDM